jgi:molybdate transport system ATP-binding protein
LSTSGGHPADEPFSALDEYLRWQVELEIAETLRQFGKPALFVSHSRDEVYRLCRTYASSIRARVPPKSPYRAFSVPDTLAACLISGCKNFSRFTATDSHTVNALDWGVTLKTDTPVPDRATFLGVRFSHVQLVDGPGENVIACQVSQLVEDVFWGIVLLATPGGSGGYSRIRIDTDKSRLAQLTPGQTVYAYIAPSDIMLLQE